jgi:hypothetical protein
VWSSLEGEPRRPGQQGSWINADEVRKVDDCVNYILRELPEASVGVVTPYKAQADRIANSWKDESRVRVGTVHTFQGGERDVMVFDLVAGPAMPGGSIAWLEAERNLWNVAISRARSHLIVVGNRSFWARRRGVGAALAEIGTASGATEQGDPLLDRLYEWLSRTPGAAVELAATVNGYRCDALVQLDGWLTPVLLDRGVPPNKDPAGHLRLQLRRAALLAPMDESGGVTRVAAWRLYDGAG